MRGISSAPILLCGPRCACNHGSMTLHRMLLPAIVGMLSLASSQEAAAFELPKGAVPIVSGITVPGLPPVTRHIHVDQFGYLPSERKVAVVSDPQKGYDAGDHFSPGEAYEVRRVADGTVVLRGSLAVFNKGETDSASGDRGWWFDFSKLKETGDFYILDTKQGLRSHVFKIAPDVYAQLLRVATRMFYYQREAFPHQAPYAEAPWQDAPTYLQDRETRAVWAKDDPKTARDLSGGWMDAGDTNKYPTFLRDVVHTLFYAWRENPTAFTDDTNIPESGNGRPDILDEVKWELDWLMKMQDVDGGVPIKMGEVSYGSSSPLSGDKSPRYYGPKCSSSTLITAGVFAHAARVYGRFDAWKDFSADLRERAERAWRWYLANPRNIHCDTGEIKSGNADLDEAAHDRGEAVAAMHLWALTGKPEYHEVFKHRFAEMKQITEKAWFPYEPGQGEALLDYTRQPGADPGVKDRIAKALTQATRTAKFMPQGDDGDLYRAWMTPEAFHWGSNFVRAGYGVAAYKAIAYGYAGDRADALRQRALDMLHSMHGVNPLGLVYLTNMEPYGAELSVKRIWHDWFSTSSPFASNPAPGYVVGGPNKDYAGSYDWLKKQPPLKCYADFNEGYPANSWEFSEPAIYYQAVYIRLISNFARH
jgi:endoglucanase